jgi:UDP-glucose 4-epimerase
MRALPESLIIVTGGAGFIGSHLVERLLAQDKRVLVIDDLSTGSLANLQTVLAHPHLTVRQTRVSDCTEWGGWMPKTESVYHLAAAVGVELVVKSPIRTIETNLRETEAILQAAGQWNVPVLITSTSEVYGKSRKTVFSEKDDLLIGPPHLGRWSYACSKLMDEFLAMAYAKERGLPVVITRLFNTVGPRQTGRYGMVLPRFIASAQANQPLLVFGNGKQTRCFCSVSDTVEALIRLQNCPAARGEVFNVGSEEEIAIADLAKRVIAILGSQSVIEYVPYREAYAPGFEDMQRRRPNIDKMIRTIHFQPTRLLQDIIESIAASSS